MGAAAAHNIADHARADITSRPRRSDITVPDNLAEFDPAGAFSGRLLPVADCGSRIGS